MGTAQYLFGESVVIDLVLGLAAKQQIKAIEDFDDRIVRPILEGLKTFPKWRILLMPDHPTPVSTRKHTSDPVPFILLDSERWKAPDRLDGRGFSEAEAEASGVFVKSGSKMIEILIKGEDPRKSN